MNWQRDALAGRDALAESTPDGDAATCMPLNAFPLRVFTPTELVTQANAQLAITVYDYPQEQQYQQEYQQTAASPELLLPALPALPHFGSLPRTAVHC